MENTRGHAKQVLRSHSPPGLHHRLGLRRCSLAQARTVLIQQCPGGHEAGSVGPEGRHHPCRTYSPQGSFSMISLRILQLLLAQEDFTNSIPVKLLLAEQLLLNGEFHEKDHFNCPTQRAALLCLVPAGLAAVALTVWNSSMAG